MPLIPLLLCKYEQRRVCYLGHRVAHFLFARNELLQVDYNMDVLSLDIKEPQKIMARSYRSVCR